MGYGKEIYEKAQEELNLRRQKAFTDAEERRRKIYTELPRARELEQQLTHTGVAAASCPRTLRSDTSAAYAATRATRTASCATA